MSFPPQFLDQLRARVSIAETIGKRLEWDKRKSNPARGDYWACCPFHGEKTPSFHVEDRKGFYYCFGCHEKGDIFGFLMKNDNLPFHEAVAQLAGEAGLAMPERDAEATRRDAARKGLIEAMEAAQRFYAGLLSGAAAREARGYLAGRGLDDAALRRFGIGYAPQGPTALAEQLRGAGFDTATLVEAGLVGEREDGSVYDRFRDRIIFPIRDPRDRMIAFGGRAMRSDAQAKYLNSPETPIFSKGQTLYNLGPARMAAGKGQTLIAAEGYMDVIALVRAGFEAAVAPLGTALTEAQLAMLWRVTDEPVLALDGDTAGIRAALRAARLALPLLAPGKTLRFVLLPDGKDPDDLIRDSGAGAMREMLEGAEPLSEFLWRAELESDPIDTPERRADFDRRLRQLGAEIRDESVRAHYTAFFREKRQALFAPAQSKRRGDFQPGNWRREPRIEPARHETRSSLLATSAAHDRRFMLEERLLQLALALPDDCTRCADSLSELEFANRELDSIRSALISAIFDLADRETDVTVSTLQTETRRKLADGAAARLDRLVRSPAKAPESDHLDLAIQRYSAFCDRDSERREAEEQFERDGDDRAFSRMMAARTAYLEELQKVMPPIAEDETATVQPFIDQEMWKRRGKRDISGPR